MRILLVLLALLATPTLAATVWKWVDANGVTHYSDTPVPGATRMELSTGSSSRNESADYTDYSTSTSSADADTPAGPPYSTFEILRPADQETVANTGGQVTIEVHIEPSLQAGHSLYVYLDGRALDGPGNALTYDLTEVARGSHTVVAVVVSSDGSKRIQETSPVTFFVRQQSIAQPPVGPAQRPPPKPQPRAGNKMLKTQPSYAALNSVPTSTVDRRTNRPAVKADDTSKPTTSRPGK
jgi:hypothetical protein